MADGMRVAAAVAIVAALASFFALATGRPRRSAATAPAAGPAAETATDGPVPVPAVTD
jgi:hypothetical protein